MSIRSLSALSMLLAAIAPAGAWAAPVTSSYIFQPTPISIGSTIGTSNIAPAPAIHAVPKLNFIDTSAITQPPVNQPVATNYINTIKGGAPAPATLMPFNSSHATGISTPVSIGHAIQSHH